MIYNQTMENIVISPWRITPPHSVTDQEKFESIRDGLELNGWTGRPILVLEWGEEWIALTGSHRIAAARAAGFEGVPCAVLPAAALIAAEYGPEDMYDDDVIVHILREIHAEEAEDLMLLEFAA